MRYSETYSNAEFIFLIIGIIVYNILLIIVIVFLVVHLVKGGGEKEKKTYWMTAKMFLGLIFLFLMGTEYKLGLFSHRFF